MMKFPIHFALCAAALMTAATVSAQTPRPERPYRGLFGAGVGDAEQLLTVSLSVGGGYDDNVLAQEGLGQNPRASRPGNFGSVTGGLAYTFTTPRLNLSLSGGTNGRYRPGLENEFTAGHSGNLGISAGLWGGSRLTASQSVNYQPYYVLDLFPSLGPDDPGVVGAPEFGSIAGDYLSYATRAGLSQQVSRRGSLGASYQQQTSDFSGSRPDFTSRGGGVRYVHSITKGLGLRIGYGVRQTSSFIASGSGRLRLHSIDAGIDFNRALSFSRRTSLSFATGSSGVANAAGTRYHFTGGAQLRHEIGRTWTAALGYDRSVQLVDGLNESVLSDGAALTLGGMISRRLTFQSRAGVSFGHLGVTGRGSDLNSYVGTAGLGLALSRHVNLGLDYSYYRYQFGPTAVLPAEFSRKFDRQSVRAYLSLWAPLVHRARRPDAPR